MDHEERIPLFEALLNIATADEVFSEDEIVFIRDIREKPVVMNSIK